jgi:hypothetical protein
MHLNPSSCAGLQVPKLKRKEGEGLPGQGKKKTALGGIQVTFWRQNHHQFYQDRLGTSIGRISTKREHLVHTYI